MSEMPDTISVQVRLRGGGEAMYVTPVSYRWHHKEAKLCIYSTIEFSPKVPWELKEKESSNPWHTTQLKYLRYTRALRAWIEEQKYNIEKLTGKNVFEDYFPRMEWDWGVHNVGIELNNDWFYAIDVFSHTFHIDGCLEIDWGESKEYAELNYDNYLTPSSIWVEERLKDDFQCWGYEGSELKEVEEKFWKWRQEQIDKGYEVYYITSLET